MYTKEELQGRIFCPDKEQWIEIALKDCLSKEEAKVQEIERGIMLPLRKIPGSNSFAGGVCDARFRFVAGLRKNLERPSSGSCDESYRVRGVQHIAETVIFGGVLSAHFGHAILECLSRLWYVVENSTTERIAFLPSGKVKDNTFTSYYADLFALLDIDPKRVIYIEKPTQFDRVIVPDETVHVAGRYAQYNEKYTAVYEKMMSRVEAKATKKIYLTRTQFAIHDCLNEEYFEEFYRRRGFAVIAPEQHSIRDQIAYMKGAEEVACTMGTLPHLLLFSRPGTRLTCILRTSRHPFFEQTIVNQAKKVDFYIVDTTFNFLPSVQLHPRCFLLAPTKYWKEYLDATGEKYAEEELNWDTSIVYDYLLKWCAEASTRDGWTCGLARFDTFDVLNSLSTVLLDKPLKREDYKLEPIIRIKNRILNMDTDKRWKVLKVLWKIYSLLPERARSAIIGLFNRRK